MKKRLTLALIFALLEEDEDYYLYTDTSYQGLRAILLQKIKVIIYTSYRLKEYELAIVVFALKI